jgi:hemerythrin-like domain-containing protein
LAFLLTLPAGGEEMRTLETDDRERFESRHQSPPDIMSTDWLVAMHEQQIQLCRELEEIADSLPSEVNRQKCIYAANAIGPLTCSLHKYEENIVFPWIEKNITGYPDLPATLERLKFEHCEDECFIEELTDTLLALGAGGQNLNAETTGYMLRGFFIGVRRHIAFEREHLMPLLAVVNTN